MNSKEIRLSNVDKIINKHCRGVRSEFARKIGKEPSSIGRWWIKTSNRKNIGDAAARHIEETFKLPEDWLDQPHENSNDLENDPQKKTVLKAQAGETQIIPLIGSTLLDHKYQLTIINNNKGKLMLLSTDRDAHAFQLVGHNPNPILDNNWGLVVEPNTPLALNEYAIIWLHSGEILLRLIAFQENDTLIARHPITGEQTKIDAAQISNALYCYVGIPPSKITLSDTTS